MEGFTPRKKPLWPPDFRLPEYNGPYPRRELEEARKQLIEILTAHPFSTVLERMKPRMGISSMYGEAMAPPPLVPLPSNTPVIPNESTMQQNSFFPLMDLRPRSTSTITGPSHLANTSLENLSPDSFQDHQSQQPHPAFGRMRESKSMSSLLPGPSFHSTPIRKRNDQWNTSASNNISINLSDPSLDSGYSADNGNTSGVQPNENKSLLGDEHSHDTKEKWNEQSISMKRKLDIDAVDSEKKRQRLSHALYYKCDFCQYQCHIKSQMESHLNSAKHSSGSLYNASTSPNGMIKLESVEKMMVVTNPYSMTKALVVACPDCRELFADIFMCSVHHKYSHGSVNGCYAICPVIRHETITFAITPTCDTCHTSFSRHMDLHQHWKMEPAHHPLQEPISPNIFSLYICPYCSKIFYKNFLACKTHVLAHPRNSSQYAVEAKHILQPQKKHEMLPFNTSGGKKDGIQLEYDILKNLQKFYMTDISGAKAKGRMISEWMKTLQCMLY